MKYKPLIIVMGEPYSIFLEILFKAFKSSFISKVKRPIILIGSAELLQKQMIFFKYKININIIEIQDIPYIKDNKSLNVINISLKAKRVFTKDFSGSKKYIDKSFKVALSIMRKKLAIGILNGPINKTTFLEKRFEGVTEYLVKQTKTSNYSMIIYNDKLSVSPITTHLPLKKVTKKITINSIINKTLLIKKFYLKYLDKKPKFAILGLNPHCESNDSISEEEKIIKPAIKVLKNKNIKIQGPFAADTFFLKDNYVKYDVVIGMYHDQVLTPIKTLFGFDAINITAGLPFIRVSPDHGPNEKMISKGISNPLSLMKSINFFEGINDRKT